jgi:hypothetical protein
MCAELCIPMPENCKLIWRTFARGEKLIKKLGPVERLFLPMRPSDLGDSCYKSILFA